MKDNDKDGTPSGESARDPAARLATAPSASEQQPKEADGREGGEATLQPVSADMQQFIGRQLRAVFDDVAKQPVPDRFLELMKQLDSKTGGG